MLAPFRCLNDIYYSPRGSRRLVSTNGLASGFTLEEALVHAICEVVERHATRLSDLATRNPGAIAGAGDRRFLDPRTYPPALARLVASVEASGAGDVLLEDITYEVLGEGDRVQILGLSMRSVARTITMRLDTYLAYLCVGVDKQKLIGHVVDWLCQAAGGPATYRGRDMVSAHSHLRMTDVHFMAAGDQIVRCLKKYNVPEPEIQEVMCAIIAHHDDVIR